MNTVKTIAILVHFLVMLVVCLFLVPLWHKRAREGWRRRLVLAFVYAFVLTLISPATRMQA